MVRKTAALLALTIVGASMMATNSVAAAPPLPSPTTIHTGATAADAGPSCWAIKQSFPASATGLYWLLTPALKTPQQFYCDMTTDGGGYVLVGRGRENWNFQWRGQGTASSVASTPTGTAAFSPAALSTQTIDGLLDGGRVDALADGVRVRRAKDVAGNTYQEVRYKYKNLSGWSWDLYGGIQLNSISFDGAVTNFASYSRCSFGTTCDVSLDSNYNRIWTFAWSQKAKKLGFSYGSNIDGQNNSSSYLWVNGSEKHATPFAQVFIRPQLGDADVNFPVIPDTGTTATTLRAMPSSTPQIMQWGVADISKPASDPDTRNDSPVLALAQVGNTMFVGGKFQNVQNGSGGPKTSQSWLAAFDVNTGVWINTWRPTLDGAVWDLVAAPDGTLIVGGNFTNVNGAVGTAGLAKLDPVTGQVVSSFNAYVAVPRFLGSRAHVRALDVHGNWLYIAGSFSQIIGGPLNTTRNTGGVARVSLTDGQPDTSWRAFFDNTIMDIDATTDGARVYVAGFFKNVGTTSAYGTPRNALAILDTTTGASVPGMAQYVPTASNVTRQWQQTVMEYQNEIFLGGSEHNIQKYTYGNNSLVRGHVTQHGGDFQAIAAAYGIVFASCHCYQTSFGDTYAWPPNSNYGRVDNVQWIGAYDATSFEKLNEWDPSWGMNTGTGEGPWEMTFDSSGCLWAGGDIIRGGYTGSVANWLAGFARFCPRDVTAPTTPTNFRTSVSSGITSLKWNASTDNNAGTITYEIMRDDRVIATQTSTTFALADLSYGRYFVRARDVGGNRSASTAVLVIGTPPTYTQVIAATPQVLAHWRLGEPSTALAAADAIGANPGTYSGGVAVGAAGIINADADTSASFDGIDGAVTIADSAGISPTAGASVETWVDLSDISGGRRNLVSKAGAFDLRLNSAGEGGAFAFSVTTVGGTFTATGSVPAQLGRHHVVGTFDGVTARLYSEGNVIATVAAPGAMIDTATPLTIGSGPDGALLGGQDEVALYSRALGIKEVNTHYSTGGRNIIPNVAPDAQIQATCGALTCGLDGAASSDDSTIVDYAWQINDGTTGSGITFVHSFDTAGEYIVTLTVTDDDGATDTATQTVTVNPNPPEPYETDTFTRTATSSWGTADLGNAWTTSGTTTNFAVNSGVGKILAPAAFASSATRLSTLLESDYDIQTRFQYDSAQSGGSWLNLVGRYVASGLEYRGRVRFGASTISVAPYRVASGSTTAITSEVVVPGLVAAPNTFYRARMNISGLNPTTIKIKVWADGTPEPATWNVNATDATVALQTLGSPGLQLFANGSASYPLTLSVDDFNVGPANAPPVPSFTSDCSGVLSCSVDGSASTDDGTIAAYTWSFGDGTTASGSTASHVYAAPGTYTITLMVTDNGGLQSSTSQSVVVQSPPTAAFTSSCLGYACSFDASTSSDPDGTITSYEWEFGDGQTATGVTPAMNYGSVGSYNVTLTVTDNQGGVGSVQHLVVANTAPTAAFTFVCPTDTCSFDATSSIDSDGSIADYQWNFGDGTTGSGPTPTHEYVGGGTHTVTLTVTDDLAATDIEIQNVVQAAAPIAGFTKSCSDYVCGFDATTSYDPDGSIVSYDWDFGDGNVGSGATPGHTYGAPGSYSVTLTVTDDSLLTGAVTQSVVADIAPSASFVVNCVVLTCSVDAAASSDSDGSIVSYAWMFGDGSQETGVTANHLYALAGSWPISLTVTDDLGVSTSVAQPAIVAPIPATTQFAGDAFDRVVANGWGTADQGGAWTASGPSTYFAVNGTSATMSLPATNNGISARLLALSQSDVDVQTKVSYNVAQTGSGSWVNVIGRYIGTNTEYRARVRFSSTLVYAQAYRAPGSSAVAVGSEVAIPSIVATPGTVYRIRLNVSGTNPTSIKIKVWADGTPEPAVWNVNVSDSTPVLQAAGAAGIHTYAGNSSSYPLVFTFDDFVVRPANLPPVAVFTSDCSGSLSCSFDASTSIDDTGIASYTWVYGDGTTSTGVTPTRVFANAGSYTVTLTVADTQGVLHVSSQIVNVT